MVLKEIVDFIEGSIQFDASAIEVTKALSIADSNFDISCVGWCSDKNAELLNSVYSGNVLVSQSLFDQVNVPHLNLIVVDAPRRAFAQLLKEFFTKKKVFGSVSDSSNIDVTVKYDASKVVIGHNVVIEEDVQIGEHVILGHNTVIKSGTIIKDNVSIGANCTIGGVGFGYELSDTGEYEVIPHIGNVILSEHVEIGNNVCIDRAVMGSTFLDVNVKVDNLVHIAHGVQIGENSLVIAHAMIAGSVNIGKNVWVAPSSAVRQKLTIDDNALIGLGSVVVKNVEKGTVVAGVPAKPISK
ncbi:MAG: hypothetical protein MK105_11335 [Crocinitomicaceae bacterium]|nr:hypothetical protein [Crocinitomicaceae bacterium]